MGHYNHVGNHHRVTAEHGFHLLVLAQGGDPLGVEFHRRVFLLHRQVQPLRHCCGVWAELDAVRQMSGVVVTSVTPRWIRAGLQQGQTSAE